VRIYKWRRPRGRIHPAKPKVGIRAACANEIWHVDITVIRLLNGSRVYLQAIIDNFSRRILAWKVSETFDPTATAGLLIEASKGRMVKKLDRTSFPLFFAETRRSRLTGFSRFAT
jgi:transposase InsO family protein